MLNLPERIVIAEVGPRDGLQSLDRWIDTDTKVAMIDRLSAAGFPVIEVTSFTRSTVVPHLKDAEEVCGRIARRPGTVYRALVPNARGAERALDAKLDELLGLITVSETYLRKNQNMSLDEAVEQGIRCFRTADAAGVGFVMAIGVALWCAYEGRIPEDKTVHNIERYGNTTAATIPIGISESWKAGKIKEGSTVLSAAFHHSSSSEPQKLICIHFDQIS